MIVCKNVSRFARNVTDCIGIVRDLAALKPPVGVFFEFESIFSLKEDSQMALTFLATMAEEESHTRSRSMETSLRMRLDNGIPLTPTVPSWESSIRRTRSNTDFDSISNHAKGKLTEALINLRYTISMMLSTIKGEE